MKNKKIDTAQLEKLSNELNSSFDILNNTNKKNVCHSYVNTSGELDITILKRDVQIDNNLECVSSGFCYWD